MMENERDVYDRGETPPMRRSSHNVGGDTSPTPARRSSSPKWRRTSPSDRKSSPTWHRSSSPPESPTRRRSSPPRRRSSPTQRRRSSPTPDDDYDVSRDGPAPDDSSHMRKSPSVKLKKQYSKIFRFKTKILQNLGKADKTTDEVFNEYENNFHRQQSHALRLHKEVANYLRCCRALHGASKSLFETLAEVYEPDWVGQDLLYVQAQNSDMLWTDFCHKVQDQTLAPLTAYAVQFPELRKKIDKRGRKLVDYDSQRHQLENLQRSNRRDDYKIARVRDQLETARQTYETLNKELYDELPTLHDERIPQISSHLQTLFAAEATFLQESSKVAVELEAIADKLHKESSKGTYNIKRGVPIAPRPLSMNDTFVHNSAMWYDDSAQENKLVEEGNVAEGHEGQHQSSFKESFQEKGESLPLNQSNLKRSSSSLDNGFEDIEVVHREENSATLLEEYLEVQSLKVSLNEEDGSLGSTDLQVKLPDDQKTSGNLGKQLQNAMEDTGEVFSIEEDDNVDKIATNTSEATGFAYCSLPCFPSLETVVNPLENDKINLHDEYSGTTDDATNFSSLTSNRPTISGPISHKEEVGRTYEEMEFEEKKLNGSASNRINGDVMNIKIPPEDTGSSMVSLNNETPPLYSPPAPPVTSPPSLPISSPDRTGNGPSFPYPMADLPPKKEEIYDIPVGATTEGLPPGVLYRVRATYKYSREDVDELAFDMGDIIQVVEYDDPEEQEEGWLCGVKESSNEKGLFPANFTRPI